MPFRRQHQGGDLCAIFVHAGAGYHSQTNERHHLAAVNDAAKVGMAILKNGGDAVDAVEMAIRLLEDREITNAGYGSNLTINGDVECDATMVDHLGRSGAVGSVSHIKNPIALARLILEASSKPLSLQRVPPNLLVGPGATDFAAEHGIPILPADYLISNGARNRWFAWKTDLSNAVNKDKDRAFFSAPDTQTIFRDVNANSNSTTPTFTPPISPSHPPDIVLLDSLTTLMKPVSQQGGTLSSLPHARTHGTNASHLYKRNGTPSTYDQCGVSANASRYHEHESDEVTASHVTNLASPSKRPRLDGLLDRPYNSVPPAVSTMPSMLNQSSPTAAKQQDHITDTVGAIAIDCFGRIAAGSSSGGIGMKHRGRCGPAALVGIGTAVIPVDADDPEKACVATVTSGTGEHMATTSAATTAAERIYLRVRRDGPKLKTCDEDEALHSMIKNDFMRHPGVQNQPCVGAIGILAVKKTRDGIYFYFGHNTDSFAIASMHSEERKPVCTMSRSKGNGSIALGGRVSRSAKAKH